MASCACRSVRPRLTIYVCREQPSSAPLQGQQAAGSGGEDGGTTPYGGHRGTSGRIGKDPGVRAAEVAAGVQQQWEAAA